METAGTVTLIPKLKKDLHCVLEVISTRFQCIVVAQEGSYVIQNTEGLILGKILQPLQIIQEYYNMGFHLKFAEIPTTSYLPLQSMSIETSSPRGITQFHFQNVLVHFDQGSTLLNVLKNQENCSFMYKNDLLNVVSLFKCVNFVNPNQGSDLFRYFGITNRALHGHSLNNYGVRNSDAIAKLDEDIRFMSADEGKTEFQSIKEQENKITTKWKTGITENINIVRYKSAKKTKVFYLDERPRRKYPFGTFEIYSYDSIRKSQVRFLYTIGEMVEGGLRPFICPISGHLGFSIRFGTSTRKFKTFSKFIKTLNKWTQPCHGTAKFKMFIGKSPEISFTFNYDPLETNKGKITVSMWDVKGIMMNTYVCSITHISEVFAIKSNMSPESNIQNQKDWVERYHCPHLDNCPRNCAAYLLNPENKLETRVAIPQSIHCNCYNEDGYSPICSKYHYYIEVCREIPIQMGGFFTTMILDYRKNPIMYKNSSIRLLLGGSIDIMYFIEMFLYGVKL
jgi:hypothetical protein